MSDPFVGKLTYFRVYSGTLKAGSYVYNSNKDKKERVGRILQMHANHRDDITQVFAGDIAAAVGLKATTTGNTLCDEGSPIVLESIEFPEPVIFVAIEPKTKVDQDRLGESLMKLADEDPTFRVRTDEETGQTIIAGMGELHLEIIVDRLLREFRWTPTWAGRRWPTARASPRPCPRPRAASSARPAAAASTATWSSRCRPTSTARASRFENKIVGGAVPKEYVPAAQAGMVEAMETGVLAGFPMEDVKVELIDGSFHEVDSSEMAFKIAGSMAFREAAKKAHPVLLEPIEDVEVVVPEEYMGDVMGDLNSRRGHIDGMEPRAGAQVIRATVPLAPDVRVRDRRPLHDARDGPRTPCNSVTTLRCPAPSRRK